MPRRPTEAEPSTALAPHLDAPQRRVLLEALRRAEDARNVMEDALVSFGRWVVDEVFGGDAGAALDERSGHPVWREMLARAGGPTLRLNRKMLSVAVRVAAHDRRITDESWRGLEVGRKQLLLPLRDEALMREAAQHVAAFKLTQETTAEYVTGLLAEQGRQRVVRVTVPRVLDRVRRFRQGLTKAGYERAFGAAAKLLPEGGADAVRKELVAARALLDRMLRKLPSEG